MVFDDQPVGLCSTVLLVPLRGKARTHTQPMYGSKDASMRRSSISATGLYTARCIGFAASLATDHLVGTTHTGHPSKINSTAVPAVYPNTPKRALAVLRR
jgi:hypothetical protein